MLFFKKIFYILFLKEAKYQNNAVPHFATGDCQNAAISENSLLLPPKENVQIYYVRDWTRYIALHFHCSQAAGEVPMRQYLTPNSNTGYLSSQVQRGPGQERGHRRTKLSYK